MTLFSESDSSEDDDSESDDNDEADGNWNLMEMMSEIQKSPSNPILNPDPPPPPNKVKTCESFDKKVADPPIRSTPDQISMNKKTSSRCATNFVIRKISVHLLTLFLVSPFPSREYHRLHALGENISKKSCYNVGLEGNA